VIDFELLSRKVLTIEREIASQPSSWRRAVELAHSLVSNLPRRGDRLALIGCGTSSFVAQAAAILREDAGHGESDAFAASEAPLDRPYDAVLAISRSGATTEVVRALERVGPGVETMAVCGVAGSPVAEIAERSVILDFADEEAIVQTRFATAVLALLRAHFADAIRDVPDRAEEVLAAPLPVDPLTFDRFVFLGSGWGVGIAHEAALKLREMAGVWSESYPAMEYRHGPISATNRKTLVWAIGALDGCVLEGARKAGATVIDSGRDPMVELVMVQRAAVAVARAHGLDPGNPPNLTRSVVLDGRFEAFSETATEEA
jgi:fructoselysine-6-P-deglycase FrlB-like protein